MAERTGSARPPCRYARWSISWVPAKWSLTSCLRVARIHFSRQRQAAKGPRLPDRQALFRELLRSDNIVRAIAEQASAEGSSEEVIRARALSYLDEMAFPIFLTG